MSTLLLALALASVADPGPITPFSSAEGSRPPLPWLALTSRNIRPTQFDVVERDGERVLMAYSASASSSLSHALDLDPQTHRRLSWRWRVDELPESADMANRGRDDYAARVCVSFEPDPASIGFGGRARRAIGTLFGDDTPLAALCYTWDNRLPAGHRATHSGNDRVGLLVLQSGLDQRGRWVEESRDVVADFETHFGSPPLRIIGVVVAAATAGTGERALSFFADLQIHPED
jgi:hypothetical protein